MIVKSYSLAISRAMYFFFCSRGIFTDSKFLVPCCSAPVSRISQPLWLMRLRVCNGSPHRGRNKWSISVRRAREQWLVGIINYMRVIGTINDSVSKTGRTTYAHCPLPVGGIECDRRHNLLVIYCLKWKIYVVSGEYFF